MSIILICMKAFIGSWFHVLINGDQHYSMNPLRIRVLAVISTACVIFVLGSTSADNARTSSNSI